jgi:hypothetical protein
MLISLGVVLLLGGGVCRLSSCRFRRFAVVEAAIMSTAIITTMFSSGDLAIGDPPRGQANTTGSIKVASSSSARELFTRLDTGHRVSKSFAAGLSNSVPADRSSHASMSFCSRMSGMRS